MFREPRRNAIAKDGRLRNERRMAETYDKEEVNSDDGESQRQTSKQTQGRAMEYIDALEHKLNRARMNPTQRPNTSTGKDFLLYDIERMVMEFVATTRREEITYEVDQGEGDSRE